jgi:acetyltransferase
MFAPKSVAVIGATENPGSVGRTLVENLKAQSFGGALYAVNPKRDSVLGVKSYPNVKAIPGKLDLAVVVTPSHTVPGIISDCADIGVIGAVIISAGFKETGPGGIELERQVLEHARRGRMRIIGPNCLGVMFPHVGLNATFAEGIARPGSVGFISQSGALCTAILDWSFAENVGFSAFISIGSMLDVGWGDLIYHLGDDPHTKSIVIYMESIGDARSFLSAAREVALTKPIIVIKVGRTEAAAKAAASHTGSLTGSDEVLDAAFKRVGVLRVNSIAELFFMAEVLGKQPRPKGPRLAILTNAGGPGALSTDMLISNGGELAELSPESMEAYNKLLPPHWSHNNPVDVLGDASAERYARAVEIISKDPHNDGVLVILTPQAMTESTATAEQLKSFAKLDGKPILASWMGGPDVAAGTDILNKANIPTFDYPDTAAHTFCYMWRYSEGLRSIYETPALREEGAKDRAKVDKIIQAARKAKRTILTESESKQVLGAYGIPIVKTHVAATENEAVKLAETIGYPIVLKLFSETITHKTDVGGVQLNLIGKEAVKNAFQAIKTSVTQKVGAQHFLGVTVQPMIARTGYELIIGCSLDAQFGPVLLFGAGGQLVEVFKDRALGLPPLNATLARRMMERTHIYTALKGVRGQKAVNLDELEQLMVRFSNLVVENPWITEIDINPLLASPERLIALDARVVVHGADMTEDKLPHSAIRPYPTQYVTSWKMKDGTTVELRPIRPEDEPMMVKFHYTLSERSVHYRYFAQLKLEERIAHERLTRICFNDYDREIAIVADHKTKKGEHEILGVGRLTRIHGTTGAEYAIVVSDKYQRHGLGTKLLQTLVDIGRKEKLARITATILPDNVEMQKVSKKVGFRLYRLDGDEDWQAEINL